MSRTVPLVVALLLGVVGPVVAVGEANPPQSQEADSVELIRDQVRSAVSGRLAQATLATLRSATRFFVDRGMAADAAVVHMSQAGYFLMETQLDSGRVHLRQALSHFRAIPDSLFPQIGQAYAQANMLLINLSLEDPPQELLRLIRDAEEVAARLPHTRDLAFLAVTRAEVELSLDVPPDSLDRRVEAAVELASELGEPLLLARAHAVHAQHLHDQGHFLRAEGRYRAALRTVEEAWDHLPVRGTPFHRAELSLLVVAWLRDLGNALETQGKWEESLSYHRASKDSATIAGDSLGLVDALTAIGGIFAEHARLDSASVHLERALRLARDLGNARREAVALNRMGNLHRARGQLDSALVSYRRALELGRSLPGTANLAVNVGNIGLVYRKVGRPDLAIEHYREAIRDSRRNGESYDLLVATTNLGGAFHELGQYDSAQVHWSDAAGLAAALGLAVNEAQIDANLGSLDYQRGDFAAAFGRLEGSIRMHRSAGDSSAVATTALMLGQVSTALGDQERAFSWLRQMPRLLDDQADHERWFSYYWAMAEAHALSLSPARDGTVLAYHDSASSALSRGSGQLSDDVFRVGFFESGAVQNQRWALAALESSPTDGAAAALAAVERGRAQALLRLMRSGLEVEAGADLAAEGRRLARRAVAAGATTLVYQVTAQSLLIWLVSPGTPLEAVRVDVDEDTLANLARSIRAALDPGGDLDACRLRAATDRGAEGSGLRRLRALVLPPSIEQRLPRDGPLVVVPSGPLHLVPFAALPLSEGEPFGLRYDLRYAPSLATLVEVEARASSSTEGLSQSLVVGNPRMPTLEVCDGPFRPSQLPIAGAAAGELAERLDAEFLTGAAASEGRVRAKMRTAPIVHLTTHGYAYPNADRSRDSWIALAPDEAHPDGLLRVSDIFDQVTVRADLVVLAACQTGVGDIKHTEGTLGWQRAFLAKGARSVLVSSWVVDEEATSRLLDAFYDHWLGGEVSKAEALGLAQREVRGAPGSRFFHPRFWASFKLVGAG